MGELADAGAVAFSDDGMPVASAGTHAARAPVRVDHRPAARAPLRGADALARRARPRGTRRGRARLRGLPLGRRVGRRRARHLARRVRERTHPRAATSPPPSRSTRCAARRRPGSTASGEATPHHLVLTDEAVRSLDHEREDEPAAAGRARPGRAARRGARRDDRGDRDRPRAARGAREGRSVRGGAVRRDRPRDGVRVALHAPRSAGAAARSRRCSSGCRPGRRGSSTSTGRVSRRARRRTSSCSTSTASGRSASSRSALAPATRGCSARR